MRQALRQAWWFLQRYQRELVMARVFEDTVRGIAWLEGKGFSPHGSSANYSFLYILLRILDKVNPSRILEFGMGETTTLTSQYVCHKNKQAHLYVVEHDIRWKQFFEKTIAHDDNVHVITPAVHTIMHRGASSLWYDNLAGVLPPLTFDCVILDGPQGTPHYSRAGVLELLPFSLGVSFVLIVDDYDRKGERETVREIFDVLKTHAIAFDFSVYEGTKQQCLIYSQDLRFLQSL